MSAPVLPDHFLKRMSPEDRKSLGKAGVLASEAAATFADKSERAMQSEIQAYCDQRGWFCSRARMDKRSTLRTGTPDFVICLPFTRGVENVGLFLAIECKMKGNVLSDDQFRERAKILSGHGEYLVAYSSKQAIDWMKQLTGESP